MHPNVRELKGFCIANSSNSRKVCFGHSSSWALPSMESSELLWSTSKMLVHEGKVCLYNFLLAIVVIFAIAIPEFRFKYSLDNWLVIFWSPLLLYGILNFVIYLYYSSSSDYQVKTSSKPFLQDFRNLSASRSLSGHASWAISSQWECSFSS